MTEPATQEVRSDDEFAAALAVAERLIGNVEQVVRGKREQNPLDHEGTFPLPEAQLDRFFMRTTLGYPDAGDELRIVQAQRHTHPLDALGTAITNEELRSVQLATEHVYIDPLLQEWVIALV